MKILFDAHTFGKNTTGIESYPQSVAKYLKTQSDISLTLYTSGSSYPQSGVSRILFGFQKAINECQPNLLHVFNFAPFYHTVPTVLTVYDLCFKICPNTFSIKSKIAFALFFERSLKQADRIICISEDVKQNLMSYYQVREEKIDVIYPAVEQTIQKDEHPHLIKEPYFLVVGDVNPRKKTEEIIQAFEMLISQGHTASLVFVGPHTDVYINRYPKLKNHVFGLGYVKKDTLRSLYKHARGIIYNSVCEGFGLPLIEAMATHTPIICRDINIFHEVAGSGALYTNSLSEITHAMICLLDQDIYKKYAHLSSERSKLFSWDNMITKTRSTYEKAIEQFHNSKTY